MKTIEEKLKFLGDTPHKYMTNWEKGFATDVFVKISAKGQELTWGQQKKLNEVYQDVVGRVG